MAKSDEAAVGRPDPGRGEGLAAVLEAMLYATDRPASAERLLEVLRQVAGGDGGELPDGIDAERVERACLELGDRYLEAGSALQIVEVAGGFRLATRPEFDDWIRALRQVERAASLSAAALQTLAVVAYRQPVTAAEIAAVRGVDPAGALRTLRDQSLVRVTGRKRAVGRPFTYGTTERFLHTFGLRDLEELPAPEEFEELLET